MAFLGYFGCLAGLNVLGLWNWTEVLTFLTLVPWVPLTTLFWAFCALATRALGAAFLAGAEAADLSAAAFLGTGFLAAGALASLPANII